MLVINNWFQFVAIIILNVLLLGIVAIVSVSSILQALDKIAFICFTIDCLLFDV